MTTTAVGEHEKREIELTAGRIRYREAGEGPPLVFVHGLVVDGRLWDGVVDALADRFRCIAPDLPFGSHRIPMSPGADLSPTGMAAIVAELIERLGLEDVTVVGNDSGGAVSQVLVTTRPELPIGRLVLTNCDTHENFPPGIFKALPPLAKLPGATWLMLQPFRVKAVSSFAFAPFSKYGLTPAHIEAWSAGPLGDSAIRRDLGKVTTGMNKRYTLAAAEALRGSELPILLAWAPGDRFFPLRYPQRLAASSGNARIVEIPDSRTFVPLDQPQRLAAEIARFQAE